MMHLLRSRFVAWLIFSIVAVSATSLPSPARADALDCLTGVAKVAFDPSKIKDAVEFQAKYGECTAYLANPTPTFAVALSLVGAAMATGILPTDAEGCINAVPNAGAKLILAAIDALGLPVPNKLKSEIESGSQDAYNNVLNEFPVLAAIAGMFKCACAIDAYAEDLVNDFLKTADSCGEVIGDIANVFVELGGAALDAGEGLAKSFGCLFTGGLWDECAGSGPGVGAPCYAVSCANGQQCYPYKPGTKQMKPYHKYGSDLKQDCGPCSEVPHGVALKPGVCGCGGGYVGDYDYVWSPPFGTKLLTSCTCPAPFSSYYDTSKGWSCACPPGQSIAGGKCQLFCPPNQQPAHKQDTSKALGSDVWFCDLRYCPPNQQIVTKTVEIQVGPATVSTTTKSCDACATGEKSDGNGPCIPCAGELSFVSNGTCQTCKPWQKPGLVFAWVGASHCEDRCVNGVYLPAVNPSMPTGGGNVQEVGVPGGKKDQSTSVMQVSPSQAKQQTPLPPPDGGGSGLKGTPVLAKQDCKPCEDNSYALNNQCHSCGKTGLADVAARACTPCAERKVANAISGVWMCTADCSRVKRGEGTARSSSSNFIVDPKDTNHCIPCGKGSQPNATHTHCVTTVSLPHGPGTVKLAPDQPSGAPQKRKTEGKGGTVGKVVTCPPRMHPNPSGTGCLPDIDMPGTLTPGSGPHPGSAPSGRAGGR